MIPDRAVASRWAAFLRNRNVDAGTAGDGAIAVAGGYALYVAGTSIDLAIGAGSTRPLRDDDLTVVDEFYGARHHASRLELDEAVLARDEALLGERGYVDEGVVLAVLEAPVTAAADEPFGRVAVRTTTNQRGWSDLAARAFADHDESSADVLRRTMQAEAAAEDVLLVASLDGHDAGVAALGIYRDLALLNSGAVLPAFRRHGVYRALVAARLALAVERGATRAIIKTLAGSPIEHAAERFGFARTGLRRRVRREAA